MSKNHQTHPVCPWWFTYTFDNPLRRLAHKPEELFAGRLAMGMRVLDLGCGFGYFSVGMAEFVAPGGSVLAVDLQEKMLKRVRKRARRADLDGVVATRRCTRESLAIGPDHGDEPADFVLAFWMAHEIPDQERVFTEIHAALRKGGRFLLVEPKLDIGRRYFTAEIERVENAGFRIEQCPDITFSFAAQFVRL